MKIAILCYPEMTAMDAIGPYEVLSRLPGVTVHFVAKTKDPIVTDTGMLTLVPELTLADLPHPEILLVPGALTGFQAAMADAAILAWIRTAHQTTRWTDRCGRFGRHRHGSHPDARPWGPPPV